MKLQTLSHPNQTLGCLVIWLAARYVVEDRTTETTHWAALGRGVRKPLIHKPIPELSLCHTIIIITVVPFSWTQTLSDNTGRSTSNVYSHKIQYTSPIPMFVSKIKLNYLVYTGLIHYLSWNTTLYTTTSFLWFWLLVNLKWCMKEWHSASPQNYLWVAGRGGKFEADNYHFAMSFHSSNHVWAR